MATKKTAKTTTPEARPAACSHGKPRCCRDRVHGPLADFDLASAVTAHDRSRSSTKPPRPEFCDAHYREWQAAQRAAAKGGAS